MWGKRILCWFFVAALLVFTMALVALLVTSLVVRPTKPQFILRNATLSNFVYFSSTKMLNSSFQVVLSSRNPNKKVGIYYDQCEVFTTYRGRQITLTIPLPATYQCHNNVSDWSASLSGYVPLGLHIGDLLAHDRTDGTVLINIKVSGRVRLKVGIFVTGNLHLDVNCPVTVIFGSKDGFLVASVELAQSCNVKL